MKLTTLNKYGKEQLYKIVRETQCTFGNHHQRSNSMIWNHIQWTEFVLITTVFVFLRSDPPVFKILVEWLVEDLKQMSKWQLISENLVKMEIQSSIENKIWKKWKGDKEEELPHHLHHQKRGEAEKKRQKSKGAPQISREGFASVLPFSTITVKP